MFSGVSGIGSGMISVGGRPRPRRSPCPDLTTYGLVFFNRSPLQILPHPELAPSLAPGVSCPCHSIQYSARTPGRSRGYKTATLREIRLVRTTRVLNEWHPAR